MRHPHARHRGAPIPQHLGSRRRSRDSRTGRDIELEPLSDQGDEDQEEVVGAEEDSTFGIACGIGCCCCCTILILIMVLCNYKGLSALKYGLTRNTFTGAVNLDKVYHGGRSMIGFWNEYVEFPATMQLLAWTKEGEEDPFYVRTYEGNMVRLAVTVEYMLVEPQVAQIYQEFKLNYESYLVSNIKSQFQTVIAKFKMDDLWLDRIKVVEAMLQGCQQVCQTKLKGYVTCWGTQLHDIHLSDMIEKRIEDRQVQQQQQESEGQKQLAAEIRAKTEVNKEQWESQIKVVNATAQANAKQIVQAAEADAEFKTKSAQAEALQAVQDVLKAGFTPLNNGELNHYFGLTSAIRSTDANLLYGDFGSQTILKAEM